MTSLESAPIVDVTTVTDTTAVVHHTISNSVEVEVHCFDGLAPGSEHRLVLPATEPTGTQISVSARTLPEMSGTLSCRFATVNDVHFGEVVAGQIDQHELGPIRRSAPGEAPYPEVMNEAAVAEIGAIDAAAVIVKGDLSVDGTLDEWAAFERCYGSAFGDRLHVVRGNHDAYHHQNEFAGDQRIDLPGVTVALLDTVIPGSTTGDVTAEQMDWLDAIAADATSPVFVMGHHQQWIPGSETENDDARRSDDYFGLHPDGSDRLDDVCARRTSIVAYAAGHTHRHRVRSMRRAQIPSIEVGCTKDFPGTWAEYRVFGDGIVQIVHRMSSAAALRWSESCRGLYSDFGVDYASYAMGSLADRCFVIRTDR
jgi:predicted phosphodiesterase